MRKQAGFGAARRVRLAMAAALCMVAGLAPGCRSQTAATLPDGSPIYIFTAPDRTLAADVPPERANQVEDLVTWMEEDLIELLERLGYQAAHLDDPSRAPGLNSYVLHFRVTRYESGGPSGFFVDRTGAPTRIDADFRLVGEGNVVVVEGQPSVDGVPDWRKAARLVDKRIRDGVNGNLRLAY